MTNIINKASNNIDIYKIRRLVTGKYIIICRKISKEIEIGECNNIEDIYSFLKEKTDYCIVEKNVKQAILDIANNKIITDWYNWIDYEGFLEGKPKYCVVESNNKKAILDVIGKKIITGWYSYIFARDFFKIKSKYCKFLIEDKSIYFDPLNKIYKSSLINKFVMINLKIIINQKLFCILMIQNGNILTYIVFFLIYPIILNTPSLMIVTVVVLKNYFMITKL